MIDPRPVSGLAGWRQAHLASTGSTNADLLKYAKDGFDADRLWLTAGEQVAGRGRRGRVWSSPAGNLHASVYLKDIAAPKDIAFLPLVCASAVHRAVSAALEGSDAKVEIKWPNDILIAGAKCCGMLLEAERSGDGLDIIIGIGINLVAHPDDTPYPATHLNAHKRNITSQFMFTHLAESFAETFDTWQGGLNNAPILDYWKSHVRGMGEQIVVNLASAQLHGVFVGIDAQGLLLLRQHNGEIKNISAGDIFFPDLTK